MASVCSMQETCCVLPMREHMASTSVDFSPVLHCLLISKGNGHSQDVY